MLARARGDEHGQETSAGLHRPVSGSAVAIFLLTIPLLRRLPKPSRVSMDGTTTIGDSEKHEANAMDGWDLAAYAQTLAPEN